MTTQEAIEFIRINKQYGDKKAICELAGVSHQTFNTMMKHEKGPDEEKWYDAEYKVLCEAVAYLKPKVAQRKRWRRNLKENCLKYDSVNRFGNGCSTLSGRT